MPCGTVVLLLRRADDLLAEGQRPEIYRDRRLTQISIRRNVESFSYSRATRLLQYHAHDMMPVIDLIEDAGQLP